MNRDVRIERELSLDASGLHIREAQAEGETSREMEGYAALFGVRSCNLVPWSSYREVYEILEPGCIRDETIKNSDVVLTSYHNNENLMGRCRQGKGTLRLGADAKGLRCVCELPNTKAADDAIELIKRGDLMGMSFAYSTNEDDSENCVSYERLREKSAEGKEVWLRHVKKVERLYDVTIACRPAYEATEVGLRDKEKAEGIEGQIAELDKREREAAAAVGVADKKRALRWLAMEE